MYRSHNIDLDFSAYSIYPRYFKGNPLSCMRSWPRAQDIGEMTGRYLGSAVGSLASSDTFGGLGFRGKGSVLDDL